ncbi:acyltransferase family protein [Acinetobacter calcoaceticus]|uniref:acyltransferase family protein n=1 Tax=Acinetobacter calcoaceticus TaxID=471 RepID=UPI0019019FAA|nr:acyltransferase family protein [Acinetobacter calcoaceticus]MBJ9721831.1 acyltransferase family protein [Acinetobacter calcoaceticus]
MRNRHIDATKGVLIFLVVLGHYLERLIGWNETVNQVILGSIYFVHMPAFVFISGMFFKEEKILEKLIYFLSLYLPFQILFQLLDAFYNGSLWNWSFHLVWFVKPYWVLWYLFSMMAWIILTFLLKKTASPVLFSFILALLVGCSPINNYDYSIGRIFIFLSFFMAGAIYGKTIFQYLPQLAYAKLFAVITLLIITAVAAISHYSYYWLFGSLSYFQLHVDLWQGMLIRSVIMLLSVLGILSLFVLTQNFKQPWIGLGQKTLPIYILHGFVIIVLTHQLSFKYSVEINIFISFVLAIMTCMVLQLQIFERLIRFISLFVYKPLMKLLEFFDPKKGL